MIKVYLTGDRSNRAAALDKIKYWEDKILADRTDVSQVYHHTGTQLWDAEIMHLPFEARMKTALGTFLQCDELHLLPCWQHDPEAILLRGLAKTLKIETVYH